MPANLTMLQAVNRVLQQSNIPRVAALDSTGTWPTKTYGGSDEADAEECIDRATDTLCTKGVGSRHSINKKFTLGSTGQIVLGTNVKKIVAKLQLERTNVTTRMGSGGNAIVWNRDAGTDQFPAGDYFFDVWEDAKFEDLNVVEQLEAIALATEYFQRLKMPELENKQGNALDAARAVASMQPVIPALNVTRDTAFPIPVSDTQQQR